MKTLIVALNSQYIHSALAPWYLKASCGPECGTVDILERTINEYAGDILQGIYRYKPDVTAFSCYIWNIGLVLELVSDLKKLLPRSIIVLGGPEVSYDAGELLEKHEQIDFILAGEGEKSFPQLLAHLVCNKLSVGLASADKTGIASIDGFDLIDGLSFRSAPGIVSKPPAFVKNLDDIPSPYTDEMLASLKNKIAYFEASRGCPFSCSYCLSSVSEGVRTFSTKRIFSDLEKLVGSGVSQIKFVDRTFNANRERAALLLKHITGRYGSSGCNFHFEVGADLFDDEIMSILEHSPRGLIQIEAGVQSTNEKALSAVCRKTDTARLLQNIERLTAAGNVHIHADLIAGLPYEDYSSFARSFDSVFSAGPHQLQLGFLKFLKGTRLRREADQRPGLGTGPEAGANCRANHTTRRSAAEAVGYLYRDVPPYEILSGEHINYEELTTLKGIAGLVDKYYNSGRFVNSLGYLIKIGFGSPFDFFESFRGFYEKNGFLAKPAALREFYTVLDRFAEGELDENSRSMFRELLRLDFLASDNTGALPAFFESRGRPALQDRYFEFLRDSGKIEALIPETAGMTPKQSIKKVHFEVFHLAESNQTGQSCKDGIEGVEGAYTLPDAAGLQNAVSYDSDADTVFLFNYISRDKVTGRYPFYITNIRLS